MGGGQQQAARHSNQTNNQKKSYLQAKNLQRHLRKAHGDYCTDNVTCLKNLCTVLALVPLLALLPFLLWMLFACYHTVCYTYRKVHPPFRPSSIALEIEILMVKVENRGLTKVLLVIKPRGPSLSCQFPATDLRQPDNYQSPQLTIHEQSTNHTSLIKQA